MPATLADIQKKYGDSVYPLYKDEMHEPYMENNGRYGYKGVVLYDELEDKLQCSICGEWYGHLTAHTWQAHDVGAEEYREQNSLLKKVSLVNKNISRKMSANGKRNIKKGKTGIFTIFNKRGRLGGDTGKWVKKSHNSIQHKNRYGLCDAQILHRLNVVCNIVGKNSVEELTNFDISKYDSKLYASVSRRLGKRKNFCEKYNIKYLGNSPQTLKDDELIARLRTFVIDNRRLPEWKDLKGVVGVGTIIDHFGSLRRAKMMAGLDQLLEEVKNK